MPNDLLPRYTVYQQTLRWIKAGVFDAMVHDLRQILLLAETRKAAHSAAILDNQTLQATPESGERAAYDGAKRKRGSKMHIAVDTLGYLLALHVTRANEQDRAQVERLAQAIQETAGDSVKLASLTKVTPANKRLRTRPSTASNGKW